MFLKLQNIVQKMHLTMSIAHPYPRHPGCRFVYQLETGHLQMIIRRDRTLANDHPSPPSPSTDPIPPSTTSIWKNINWQILAHQLYVILIHIWSRVWPGLPVIFSHFTDQKPTTSSKKRCIPLDQWAFIKITPKEETLFDQIDREQHSHVSSIGG